MPVVEMLAAGNRVIVKSSDYTPACGELLRDMVASTFDPEVVKQVFQAPADQLRAGEANALLGPVLGERSVLLLDGHEHLRQRRLMLPSFHGQRMRAYELVMQAAADAVIDRWPVGRPFPLLRSMQALRSAVET